MKMTEEAIKRFNDTVRGFGEAYGVEVICDHVGKNEVTIITFVHPHVKSLYRRDAFRWAEATSITAGLTVIFVGAVRWLEEHNDFEKLLDEQAYISADVLNTSAAIERQNAGLPKIKKVHFSGPVTCVIWADGTKTLVRCGENDILDHEKGLAMDIAKKALGTNASGSNYYDIFKEWLPEKILTISEAFIIDAINEKMERLTKDI